MVYFYGHAHDYDYAYKYANFYVCSMFMPLWTKAMWCLAERRRPPFFAGWSARCTGNIVINPFIRVYPINVAALSHLPLGRVNPPQQHQASVLLGGVYPPLQHQLLQPTSPSVDDLAHGRGGLPPSAALLCTSGEHRGVYRPCPM